MLYIYIYIYIYIQQVIALVGKLAAEGVEAMGRARSG
jgi:hypothetical protein